MISRNMVALLAALFALLMGVADARVSAAEAAYWNTHTAAIAQSGAQVGRAVGFSFPPSCRVRFSRPPRILLTRQQRPTWLQRSATGAKPS